MNYLNIYKNIIINAKNENRIKRKRTDINFIYYENHHIIPKCLCKNKIWVDFSTNKVLLTAKEHFICHLLLTKIYPSTEMLWAFKCMEYRPNGKRIYSKMFELYRGKYRHKKETLLQMSIMNKGKHLSYETKEKISISRKNNKNIGDSYRGEKNGMYGKHLSDEAKKKISENSINYWKNIPIEKYNELMEIKRQNSLGEKNGMYGKHLSDEAKKKISEKLIEYNKHLSDEERCMKYGHKRYGKDNPMSKKLKIKKDDKEWIIHGTLQQFCKENNLSYNMMLKMVQGYKPSKKSKNYGWIIKEIND